MRVLTKISLILMFSFSCVNTSSAQLLKLDYNLLDYSCFADGEAISQKEHAEYMKSQEQSATYWRKARNTNAVGLVAAVGTLGILTYTLFSDDVNGGYLILASSLTGVTLGSVVLERHYRKKANSAYNQSQSSGDIGLYLGVTSHGAGLSIRF